MYDAPTRSTRGGPVFSGHPYPTKINPDAILPFILTHTEPGGLVFDPFGGSGSTAIAAALCEMPTEQLAAQVNAVIDDPDWGARRSITYDVSPLAAFIGSTILDPPDPVQFRNAAYSMLSQLEDELAWLYHALSPEGKTGRIRHIIWTDFPICPRCSASQSYWDLAVALDPLQVNRTANCQCCGQTYDLSRVDRLKEEVEDVLLGRTVTARVRRPAFVYGESDGRAWRRPVTDDDMHLWGRITSSVPLPTSIPLVPMMHQPEGKWGELHRAGYHTGITHMHQFYTKRNLIAVAKAWELCDQFDQPLANAMRYWVSGYNATHSTLMSRVVVKRNARDFALSGAQSATLYVSSLPVEKNVLAGLRARIRTVSKGFGEMHGRPGGTYLCRSSTEVDLPDGSVDYVFADPPFGDNIQYSEVNFIGEAWLGAFTERSEEAIVSVHEHKDIGVYEGLLTRVFRECHRVLKSGGVMTLAFHSSQPAVWKSLRNAWTSAGFEFVRSSTLDKTQGSLKQVLTRDSVKGDSLILLRRVSNERTNTRVPVEDPWVVVEQAIASLPVDSRERHRHRLFGLFVNAALDSGVDVPAQASEFYRWIEASFDESDELVYARDP